MERVMEILQIADQLNAQVNIFIFNFVVHVQLSITIQRLTVNGNSGGIGPTAIPLARLVEKSEPEHAQLPCSEARTVLATKLRRLSAQVSLSIQHLCF